MNIISKRGNNKLMRLVRRFVWWIKHRKYMIDTRKIKRSNLSKEQIALNRWKRREMELIGLSRPYDSPNDSRGASRNVFTLTQFGSIEEYVDATMRAVEFLDEFKPIPEPLRTKLIKEEENLRKQSGRDY